MTARFDISYLKTSRAFQNTPIHSSVILPVILSWLAAQCRHHEQLLAFGVSTLGQPQVRIASAPWYVNHTTVLELLIVAMYTGTTL